MFGKLNVLVVGADGNLGSVVYAKLKSESCKPKTNLNKVFGIGRITNDFNYYSLVEIDKKSFILSSNALYLWKF